MSFAYRCFLSSWWGGRFGRCIPFVGVDAIESCAVFRSAGVLRGTGTHTLRRAVIKLLLCQVAIDALLLIPGPRTLRFFFS
ncbi:hypothetical protein BDR05DRAFT_274100 [Suillus weaverae]|nr:hypothetical protein BDR05DRAFT_274100 [Suillus weaverae]